MLIILAAVLVLAIIVRGSGRLAALWRGPETIYPWMLEELPADYGQDPQRPWEHSPRRRARLTS